jgi:hypothetical protein
MPQVTVLRNDVVAPTATGRNVFIERRIVSIAFGAFEVACNSSPETIERVSG